MNSLNMRGKWIWVNILTPIAAGLAIIAGCSSAQAQDTVPVVKMVNGTPIDPTSADNYYNARYPNPNIHSTGLCTLNSTLCGLPRPTPIVELARSLSRGGALSQAQFTQNVFEYVYRNIDTEFRYGLSKGAFGALLDQSGTPFDQAHLMVELLRQGGVSASYQAGTVTLSAAQVQAWTGLTNAQAVCQYLANGGIPAIVNGSSAACTALSGNVTSASIAHIWVSANGTLYDPSFKTYIQKAGIDLAAAMGCGTASAPTCGASAIAAGIPASSQGYDSTAHANYVQSVQYAALGTTLNGFAINLQHYIQQNAPTANVQDIVGGQQIDPASAPSAGGLSYTVATMAHSWASDIPDQYRSRINVQFNGINQWLFADETYGYWLHVGGLYQSNFSILTATLFFEMERNSSAPSSGLYTDFSAIPTNEIFVLASGTVSSPGYTGTVHLNIDHPYASASGVYMDDAFAKTVFIADEGFVGNSSNPSNSWMNPFLIVQGWGRAGRGAVDRAGSTALGKYPSIGGVNGGRMISTSSNGSVPFPILTTTTLPKTVATWLNQASMATAMIDGFSGTRSQEQHSFGIGAEINVSGQDSGFGLDIWSNISLASGQGNSGAIAPSFAAETAAYNALEGSSVEQGEDMPDGQSAIRWFELTNEKSNRFYLATPSNISNVLASTSNYNSTSLMNGKVSSALLGNEKNFVQSYFNVPGVIFNVIVPKNGSVGTWTNNGATLTYLAAPMIAYSLDNTQIAYVLTADWKGAGSNVSVADPVGASLSTTRNIKPQKPLIFSVDEASGVLTTTFEPDWVTGSGTFPNSIQYRRSYSSSDVSAPECQATNSGFGIYLAQCSNGGFLLPPRRLTAGWRDNFEIEADFANDGARALGSDTALDASSAISAFYTIRNLAQAPSFVNYLGQAFASAWITDQIGANAIVIRKPPATETYIRLPDGTFNPRPGEPAKIVQTGSRIRYLGPNGFAFQYESISLLDTDRNGSQLSFRSYIPSDTKGYNPGSQFEPISWSFTNGTTLTFNYTNSDPTNHVSPDKMTGVSNNLGRSLSFAADSTANNDPDGYNANASMVTDDNGMVVRIRDISSAQLSLGFGPTSSTKVILPDGKQWRINYLLLGSSPDFTDARMGSIASANNPTGAYLSFAWDSLYRVKSVTDANAHTSSYFPAKVSGEKFASGYMVDAIGNVNQTWFDGFNHPVKTLDPLGRISAKAYDDIGQLVLDANPQLGCTAHAYDVRGNETTSSQYQNGSCTIGDPQTGQILSLMTSPPAPLVSSAIYMEGAGVFVCANWAICNKPASQTDAKNQVTNYAWDATTGNLTQILKPADQNGVRPEVDLIYTPLTGASACGNGATANGMAMLCQKTEKISSAASVVTSYAYNPFNKYVLQSAVQDVGGLNYRSCYSFDAMGNLISKTEPDANLTSCP